MDRITLTLTSDEQRVCWFLAKRHIEEARKDGAKATIYNGTPAVENEIQAYGAEFAYCKMFNVWPTMEAGLRLPFDARLRDGSTVDVKHTQRDGGRLLVKVMDREQHPVYYALMIGKFPTYTFVQHCRAEDVLVPERIDNTLQHPAYAVRQGECMADVPINDVVLDKPPKQGFLW